MPRPMPILLLAAALGVPPALALDETSSERAGMPDLGRLDVGGKISLSTVGAVDMAFAGTHNPTAIKMAPGNRVSFCPALSCIRGPADGTSVPAFFDHQRASLLVSGPTQLDGQAQEQLLAVIGTVASGYAPAWKAKHTYTLGDNITVHGPNGAGAVYRATRAGMSGTAPPPAAQPASASFTYADGTVIWQWINAPAINAKVGIYNEQVVKAGAGSSWAQANNVELRPGVIPTFNVNTEFDFGNRTGIDCGFGNGDCYNLFIRSGGTNMLTSAVTIDSIPDGPWSAYWGLRVTGPKTAKLGDIVTDASGEVGVGICSSGIDTCHHSRASILDQSISPIGLQFLQGASGTTMHSVATIVDDTTSPTFVSIAGNKSLAGIFEHSTTPTGILLQGRYAAAQISGAGWSVNPAGILTASRLNSPLTTPASSKAPCQPGDWAHDANFVYTCVAANTWKRAALSSW